MERVNRVRGPKEKGCHRLFFERSTRKCRHDDVDEAERQRRVVEAGRVPAANNAHIVGFDIVQRLDPPKAAQRWKVGQLALAVQKPLATRHVGAAPLPGVLLGDWLDAELAILHGPTKLFVSHLQRGGRPVHDFNVQRIADGVFPDGQLKLVCDLPEGVPRPRRGTTTVGEHRARLNVGGAWPAGRARVVSAG